MKLKLIINNILISMIASLTFLHPIESLAYKPNQNTIQSTTKKTTLKRANTYPSMNYNRELSFGSQRNRITKMAFLDLKRSIKKGCCSNVDETNAS